MSDFPLLKTGAVMQYPAEKELGYATHVMRFVDGSEQRCREYSVPLHRWLIRLDLLDEMELATMEEFFLARQGSLDAFSFTDPWDGTPYPNCSFENEEAVIEYLGEGRGRTALVVKENRI